MANAALVVGGGLLLLWLVARGSSSLVANTPADRQRLQQLFARMRAQRQAGQNASAFNTFKQALGLVAAGAAGVGLVERAIRFLQRVTRSNTTADDVKQALNRAKDAKSLVDAAQALLEGPAVPATITPSGQLTTSAPEVLRDFQYPGPPVEPPAVLNVPVEVPVTVPPFPEIDLPIEFPVPAPAPGAQAPEFVVPAPFVESGPIALTLDPTERGFAALFPDFNPSTLPTAWQSVAMLPDAFAAGGAATFSALADIALASLQSFLEFAPFAAVIGGIFEAISDAAAADAIQRAERRAFQAVARRDWDAFNGAITRADFITAKISTTTVGNIASSDLLNLAAMVVGALHVRFENPAFSELFSKMALSHISDPTPVGSFEVAKTLLGQEVNLVWRLLVIEDELGRRGLITRAAIPFRCRWATDSLRGGLEALMADVFQDIRQFGYFLDFPRYGPPAFAVSYTQVPANTEPPPFDLYPSAGTWRLKIFGEHFPGDLAWRWESYLHGVTPPDDEIYFQRYVKPFLGYNGWANQGLGLLPVPGYATLGLDSPAPQGYILRPSVLDTINGMFSSFSYQVAVDPVTGWVLHKRGNQDGWWLVQIDLQSIGTTLNAHPRPTRLPAPPVGVTLTLTVMGDRGFDAVGNLWQFFCVPGGGWEWVMVARKDFTGPGGFLVMTGVTDPSTGSTITGAMVDPSTGAIVPATVDPNTGAIVPFVPFVDPNVFASA